jgi:DNA polymerase elongation subunit (family B)
MIEGWLLDVHANEAQTGMVVWLVEATGRAVSCEVPWAPSVHVHASTDDLVRLADWLMLPEISARFAIVGLEHRRMHLNLNGEDLATVLEIRVEPFRHLKALAEHIEARGEFHRYTLYSVDAHLVQRFLNDHQCSMFSKVRWNPEITPMVQSVDDGEPDGLPPLCIVKLGVEFAPSAFPSVADAVTSIRLEAAEEPGFPKPLRCGEDVVLMREDFPTLSAMLCAFESAFLELDPDVVLTYGADKRIFPWLVHQMALLDRSLALGRSGAPLCRSTEARTVRSYGNTRHRDGAFFLEGRLHLDLRNSFIVKEGGVSGLFELAQQSSQSAQVIARLSPGSVISAIQMRVAMDDGVLVPWKKNRPEDTKSALELLHADRGGLYLDSRPGVYASVIELDFASLFPSIIATRNISPETLNCACCQPSDRSPSNAHVPLHPDEAIAEFRQRHQRARFGHTFFPLSHEKALKVPGLQSHTCGRQHGFLGRVVAPLIERRRQLKARRKAKGDGFDLRQNALKWLLVTCFGYTGYRNARFGRIEAHEAICAWSRDILLTTIEEAQHDGWEVLHAIVDCVWLADRAQRSPEQQRTDAKAFAHRITQLVGIPLEFEQHYEFIGFLPSRVHGAGSLTKYWAYGGDEFKVRGIEMRQHSTPPWVRWIQQRSLEVLVSGSRTHGLPNREAQRSVADFYRSELRRLERGEVGLNELLIARRITTELGDYRVKNLSYAALVRAHHLGQHVPPGGKIRYAVVNASASEPLERVVLAEECSAMDGQVSGCIGHYSKLARRAVWAILAPFGWTDEDLESPVRQPSLLDFVTPRHEGHELASKRAPSAPRTHEG